MFLSRSTQMLTLMRPTCSRIVIVRNRQKGIVVEPKDLGRFQRSIEKSFMKLAQRRFGLKYNVVLNRLGLSQQLVVQKKPSPKYMERRSPLHRNLVNSNLRSHVIDLLSSGEFDSAYEDLNVDILKVELSRTGSSVNIEWAATGTDRDDYIEERFSQLAQDLRSALLCASSLNNLPPIKFVKNSSALQTSKLYQTIAEADKGTIDDEICYDSNSSGDKAKISDSAAAASATAHSTFRPPDSAYGLHRSVLLRKISSKTKKSSG